MIKSLLDAEDEPQTSKTNENPAKNASGDDVLELPEEKFSAAEQIPMVEPLPEKETAEISELVEKIESGEADFRTNEELERKIAEIERRHKEEIEQLLREKEIAAQRNEFQTSVEPREAKTESFETIEEVETVVTSPPETAPQTVQPPSYSNPAVETPVQAEEAKPFEVTPESRAESIRQTGMAWSAAIALFGSILFFMIIGWFADLLLDTTPWGLVGGIIIGGILGFIQFFRINAMIFKSQKNEFEATSLKANENAVTTENQTLP